MKKNMLVAAGIALVLAFSPNNLKAQNDAPAPGLVPATNQAPAPPNASQTIPSHFAADNPNPPPGANQPSPRRFPAPRFRQPRAMFARTLGDLRMMKLELQRCQGDLGGHKDSAIAACDKAIQELTAAMKGLPPLPPPQQLLRPPPGATPAPNVAPPQP